jgi:hypothetical protein
VSRRGWLGAAALVAALLAPPVLSEAAFTGGRASPGSVARADRPSNYLHLYSQATDPAGLTAYADKRLSNPVVKAATGVDATLRLALGNWRNGGTMLRALTIETPAALPATPVTVALDASVPSLGYTGTPATIAAIGSAGGTTTATLAAGQKRQVNLVIPQMPGTGVAYSGTLNVTVTYQGYTGTFLRYSVPLTIYDGNTGAGP